MPETPAMVEVTLCWSLQPRQVHEHTLSVQAGSTVQTVLDQFITAQAHVLSATESAQLKFMQPGIWGRKVVWTDLVHPGDRVELYRPLNVDPKVARRQRFKRQGKGRTGLFANRKSGSAAGY